MGESLASERFHTGGVRVFVLPRGGALGEYSRACRPDRWPATKAELRYLRAKYVSSFEPCVILSSFFLSPPEGGLDLVTNYFMVKRFFLGSQSST